MRLSSRVILGIDPGIARLGYGIIRSSQGTIELVATGVFETSNHLVVGERLAILWNDLNRLIKKHKPQLLVLERLFFSKNVKTAMIVGEARGMVLLSAAKHNLPVLEVSPNVMKQSITGYGSAEKRQVQSMLKALFHLQKLPASDDAADALALAFCGTNHPLP